MFRSVPEVALFVRDQRVQRGWTQGELAARAGVGREWLNRFERGRVNSQASVLMDLLAQLGYGLDVVPAHRPPVADVVADSIRPAGVSRVRLEPSVGSGEADR